ncbi:MAG TPA: cupin domain-containing protein [Anaerolineaceae bacterium]|nr:MAG: cupin [Chloroflexi bacterium GWB2_54_36]HAL16319.1 cupin domain-containing protein [Anaerolineaceae bacterium]
MNGYHADIEKITLRNEYFREVLFTGPHSQLVAMAIKPGDEIGTEIHNGNDQFFRIEAGKGKAVLAGKEFQLEDGMVVVVPAGVQHNIINTSANEMLKLYTIYSPPQHPDGTVHKTKAEADAHEHHH